jgi:serine protease
LWNITNNRLTQLDTLYAGLFCDWDIDDYSKNRAEYDYSRKLGYAYCSLPSKPYAGVALLTNQEPTYYAMDNGTVPDINNINPNAGFSTAKKLKTLKSGIGRAQAGMISTGFDISNVTGARLLNLAPGETQTVAFAILAANNLSSLKAGSDAIKAKFIDMKTSKIPTGDTYYLCDGETKDVIFTPGNGTLFNFYAQQIDVIPLAQNNTYTEINASTATTLYVAGADSLYESTTRVPMYVDNASTAKANFGTSVTTLVTGTPLYLFNSSTNYTSITWDYGDGNSDVDIENPSHSFTTANTYTVTLTATDDKGCSSTKTQSIVVSINTGIQTFPNPANTSLGFGDDIKDAGNLQVVNSIGQIIHQEENSFLNNTHIDVAPWPQGVYTIVFTTDNKQYTQKILVRH